MLMFQNTFVLELGKSTLHSKNFQVAKMTTLFRRALLRTNSMAVREPAVVASGVLMVVGTSFFS
jgi:hypothetical protein